MKKINAIFGIGLSLTAGCVGVDAENKSAAGTGVFDQQTGNPFIPGYTADGSIFFDEPSQPPFPLP